MDANNIASDMANLKAIGRYVKPTKASCVRDWSSLPQAEINLGSRVMARDVLIITAAGSFFGNVRGNGRVVGKKQLIVRKQASGNYMQVGL